MASTTLTGSFQGSSASAYAIKCECTSTSNGSSSNTSNVTVRLYMRRTSSNYSGQWNLNNDAKASITINGSTSSSTTNFDTRSTTDWILLKTYTVNNISHNSDGSKSISISATFEPNATSTLYGGKVSGTFKLDTILRASSITSAGNVTLGNACSVKWTPASTSFKYKIKFSLGGWNYTTGFISPNTTSAYTYTGYTIPNTSSLLDDIPNSTTGTMTATLTTYNSSGTQIGSSSSKTFTVTIPSSVVPTVGTITLTPEIINGKSILVQGKNKITVAISGCSAGTGSSIKSYTFSGPGISSTTTSTSVTGGPVSNTGTLKYTVTVTDNRGRTASKTATITCYAYAAPYFKSFNAYRIAAGGKADENGEYMKCKCELGYSSVNNTNDISVKIFYKKNTATTESSVSFLTDSTSTYKEATVTNSSDDPIKFDINSTYTIYATITDNYSGSSNSQTITIFGASRILNISEDGTGFAIGKMSESNNSFECKWDAKFYGTASGPSGFSTSSDRRVKKNIQDINIDIIDGLCPVSYELLQSSDNKTHYGFIAQDVNEVLSNAGLKPDRIGLIGQIFNNGREEYVLTYTEFIPLLTKKCQELQAEINMLKEEISELKGNTT